MHYAKKKKKKRKKTKKTKTEVAYNINLFFSYSSDIPHLATVLGTTKLRVS